MPYFNPGLVIGRAAAWGIHYRILAPKVHGHPAIVAARSGSRPSGGSLIILGHYEFLSPFRDCPAPSHNGVSHLYDALISGSCRFAQRCRRRLCQHASARRRPLPASILLENPDVHLLNSIRSLMGHLRRKTPEEEWCRFINEEQDGARVDSSLPEPTVAALPSRQPGSTSLRQPPIVQPP